MPKVDQDICIGCGHCTQVCSEVFEMGDKGKAQVKKGQQKSKLPCVQEAVDECPVHCISK
jgi:ferredoxin